MVKVWVSSLLLNKKTIKEGAGIPKILPAIGYTSASYAS